MPPIIPLMTEDAAQNYANKKTVISDGLQAGAGDGNRTHVTSLEGWSSTIELHPHLER